MALNKKQKDEIVARYVEILKGSNGFVVVQYSGMKTQQIDQLRAKIRDAQGQYAVTKNTLLTKALQQLGWPIPDNYLTGPTAVAFGMTNFPAVAKAVLEYTALPEFTEKVKVAGGVMDADILNPADVTAVSKLPTLDELRSQIIGVIVAPATGLASILHAATGSIINVLQALEDKHNEGNKPEVQEGSDDTAA